jgi:hypothetical protein
VLLLKLVAPTVDGVLDDVSKGTAMTLAFWR